MMHWTVVLPITNSVLLLLGQVGVASVQQLLDIDIVSAWGVVTDVALLLSDVAAALERPGERLEARVLEGINIIEGSKALGRATSATAEQGPLTLVMVFRGDGLSTVAATGLSDALRAGGISLHW